MWSSYEENVSLLDGRQLDEQAGLFTRCEEVLRVIAAPALDTRFFHVELFELQDERILLRLCERLVDIAN